MNKSNSRAHNYRKRNEERLAVKKNSRMKDKARRFLAPKNLIIIVLFVLIAAAVIRDSRGLNIYQKMFIGKQTVLDYPNMDKDKNQKIKILIDPGHGGKENGAIAFDGKKKEKDLNLEVSKRLERQLKSAGFEVEMTRTTDVSFKDEVNADLAARQEIIEKSNADVFVSVHMNSLDDPSISGPIVFYLPGSTQGQKLAKNVQNRMNDKLEPPVKRSYQSNNFVVLRAGEMPSILVESGFISNKQEFNKLKDKGYQEKVAMSVAYGIMDYLNSNKK